MKTNPAVLRLGLVLAVAAVGPSDPLTAAPALPVPVPYADFENEPYRWVGVVRTDSYSVDPTVLGTGWVAGQQVVVSAAHVFFVDETLGWNRNRWFFRRVARPEDFWKVDEARRPRAYRALAGYASAAGRSVETPSAFYDALNRDTIALLFYQSVYDGAPAARLVNGLAGTASFDIAGYPALLAGEPSEEIARMYAHVGGQMGTFARWDERPTDIQGNPFELFVTSDLQSGPGGSGGPVFRWHDGGWKVAGVLLAGATDYSQVFARSIDAQADTLITQAIADAGDPAFGQLIWRKAIPNHSRPPLCRADGSIVYVASDSTSGSYVEALDSNGEQRWRTRIDRMLDHSIAERPDGTLLVRDFSFVFVLDGGTGEIMWSTTALGSIGQFAIGPVGEFYYTHEFLGRVTRFSPRGVLEWSVDLPQAPDDTNPYREMSPLVARDGTILVIRSNRVHALDPTTGAVRWTSAQFELPVHWTLAPASDGGVFLIANQTAVMLEPDGAVRWSTLVPGAGINAPVLTSDGRAYVPSGSTGMIHVLGPGGAKEREVPFPHDIATSFVVDTAGTVYVGLPDRVEAYSAGGILLWTHDEGGHVSFAPGNRLVVTGPGGTALSVISTAAGRDDGAWMPLIGGPDHARRAANTVAVAPYIVTAPSGKRVVEGFRLELEVEVDGSHPLTFEWRRDGVLIPDQIGRRLRIESATTSDSGAYTATARNLAGTITSAPAIVTVAAAQFGDPLWTTSLRLKSSAAIADDGTVYAVVGVMDPVFLIHYYLVALNPYGTELWRHDFNIAFSEDTSVEFTPVVIGDDGRLFVASPGYLWCISSQGTVLWKAKQVSENSDNTPDLALGPGRTIYAVLSRRTRIYDYDGNLGWELEGSFYSSGFDMRTRRDGSVCIGSSVIGPDGAQRPSLPGYPELLGPDDETISTVFEGGVKTWSRTGVLLAHNTAATSTGGAGLFLENLEMAFPGAAIHLLPFKQTGERLLATTSEYSGVIATLQGNRLLVQGNGVISAYQHTGELLGSFTLPTGGPRPLSVWGSHTVGRQGQFIPGNLPYLSAFSVVWPLANSPWPSLRGDPRNSHRAPGTYALTRDNVFRIDVTGPVRAFSGYTTTLHARVLGAGGATQWKKNGVPLPGATGTSLQFTATQLSDAGDYAFEVTTAAGTFTSPTYTLAIEVPAASPPGLHVGLWPLSGGTTPYAMTIGTDARFELIITGPLGRTAHGRLNSDGTFAISGSPAITGQFQDGQLSFTSGPEGAVAPMFAPASGLAPNGIPAGIYRGRSRGPDSWPGNAIVFADGTIAYAPAWPAQQARAAITNFAGSARTIEVLDALDTPWTSKLVIEAAPEGVLHGTYVGYDPQKPEFTLLWSGRPRTERLANLSTRGYISPSAPPMIAGFVLTGNTPHALLLRGAGPGLALVGVQQPLRAARVRLMDHAAIELRTNAGWADGADATTIRQAALRLSAFPFADGSHDAALYDALDAGLYTMLAESADETSGIALVEAYEDVAISGRDSRLINLSTRGTLGTGERSLIGGFVIEGTQPKSLLIRAVGPGLIPIMGAGTPVAADPRLDLYAQNATSPMAGNDDWSLALTPDIAVVAERVGAFPLGNGTLDAALLVSLPPGIYTAVASSQGFADGVALLEIYEIED